MAEVVYNEGSIQTLDSLEHIRLRPGMYIGRIGDGSNQLDGPYILLKEVLDNSVDEFIMGAGAKVEIKIDGRSAYVKDFGRGIPHGKLEDCVSKINTGGKYNSEAFQFSVGMNGVGLKAVNALSEEFVVTSSREGLIKTVRFEKGRLVDKSPQADNDAIDALAETASAGQLRGTEVRFTPDSEVFRGFSWNLDFIKSRVRYYTFLNPGLEISLNGETFTSSNGLTDLILSEVPEQELLYTPARVVSKWFEVSFCHTNNYGEQYFSFVNGQHTIDGGTHQSAFKEGILRGVNDFSGSSFAAEDVRDGIVGAVAIKLESPVFESQTKNKLGSTEIRQAVMAATREAVVSWSSEHKEAAKKLVEKVKANERMRKELAAIKKDVKARIKSTTFRIPKLTDCHVHLNSDNPRAKESAIFIAEGDSAGGAMIQARDVVTQAVFTLKGKPLNCFGQTKEALYKNVELFNLMQALGIEDGLDGLRYQKVVLATDADVDGAHIRNLLVTYFLRFFEDLVLANHLYILETPLFRVRNKKAAQYCYSEAERDAAQAKLAGSEVTRFKGLGEISPQEFKQFLGGSSRLTKVTLNAAKGAQKSLEFCMGKNTPERKTFILNNLKKVDS